MKKYLLILITFTLSCAQNYDAPIYLNGHEYIQKLNKEESAVAKELIDYLDRSISKEDYFEPTYLYKASGTYSLEYKDKNYEVFTNLEFAYQRNFIDLKDKDLLAKFIPIHENYLDRYHEINNLHSTKFFIEDFQTYSKALLGKTRTQILKDLGNPEYTIIKNDQTIDLHKRNYEEYLLLTFKLIYDTNSILVEVSCNQEVFKHTKQINKK